jgi:hypothetical protein
MNPPDFTDRLIARALRERNDEPPENFAAQTTAFVHSTERNSNDRLESWLQRALLGVLGVAAAVTLLLMGGRVLAELTPAGGTGWIYTVVICGALSLGMQHLVQRRMSKT